MNRGIFQAASAYALWGVSPLFFKQLTAVPAFEVVLQRSIWSLLFIAVVLAVRRHWDWWRVLREQPRQLVLLAISALLVSANWIIYVWAVNHDRVLEASLGYFINPLLNVLLGVLVLHERLRGAQWMALALAGAGVLWLALLAGSPPWIALSLSVSFAAYGLIRKTAVLGALEGLAVETLLLALVAIPVLAWMAWQGHSVLPRLDAPTLGWLALSGPMTAVPLLLFAAGARRLTMTSLGVLQYISPTIGFVLGVWVFREPFDGWRLVGFVLIWSALAVYTIEGWWRSRRLPVPAPV